jgi:ABC-2 type transport system ATP-binding protein
MNVKMDPSPIIKLEQLKITLNHKAVINDFSLSVNPGEHLVLLGSKGSGKSTLLKTLMGFIRPESGLAQLAGYDCWKQSLEIRHHCGYIPAIPVFDKELTINDLLNLSAILGREQSDWDYIQSLADRFHLQPRKRVASLTPAEVKLTGFILGFMFHPDVILVDEPYLSLDEDAKESIDAFLNDLPTTGQTLVAAISDPSQVGQSFNKVALLLQGTLVSVTHAERLAGQLVRKVEITFGAKPPLEKLTKSGMIRQLSWDGTTLRCFVIGPSGTFLKAIEGFDVLDIKSREADLDEIIQAVYLGAEDAS